MSQVLRSRSFRSPFFPVATLSTGIEFGQRQTKPRLGDNENDGMLAIHSTMTTHD